MRIFTTILLILFSFGLHAQTYTWSGNQQIPDNATITVPIAVSGLQNIINNDFGVAHICLNITHSYSSDLTITLRSPSGTVVTLIENIGGSGNNFSGTCLGMDGVAFVNAQSPYTGIFFPVGVTSNFNNGQNPNGTWILSVTDVAAPDAGSIQSAYIEFTNNPPVVNGTPGPPTGNYQCATCTCPGNVPSCDLLPDMTASFKEINLNHTEQPGVLYISNATPNIGSGPLDIYGVDSCFCNDVHVPCGTVCPNGEQIQHVVKQRIYKKNAGNNTLTYYDRPAGKMSFHPTHGHLHVDNWANYTLRTATSNPDARTWPIVAQGTKQSFCLINLGNCASNPGECVDNNGNTVLNVPNHGLGWHNGCGLYQGIYPGMYDVYSENLNDPMPLIDVCNGDYYIVSITDPDNNFLESDETNNWVAVPITLTQQNVAPVISASGSTIFCQGGSVTLTSTPALNYLWSTGETTQSIVVTSAGTYQVTTNCGAAVLPSNTVITSIVPANTLPSVAISLTTGTNPTCTGALLEFTATGANGGSNPTYQWKVNGVNAGTNSPVFSTSSLPNGSVVSCVMLSSISCLASPTTVSNTITLNITAPLAPAISIARTAGTNPSCQGNQVTFTAAASNVVNPVYQWKVNGVNAGTNASTFSTTSLTNGQVVSCQLSASENCPVNSAIGTGTALNDYRSNAGAAYPTYYGNGRQQYLVLAAELNAMGINAGKINSLSFHLTGITGDPLTLQGYTIKIGQTLATAMTNTFQTPLLSTVYGPTNYTPIPNAINRHSFSTAFEWNGVSNLIIDICFHNNVVGNAAYQNRQTPTSFVSTTYYQADGSGGADACVQPAGQNTALMRPNMIFNISEKALLTSNTITMSVSPTGNTFMFTGSGNWNLSSNWAGNSMPPATLTGCNEIIIDPLAGQECVLNVSQVISAGTRITVRGNKKFRVMGNLTIQN